tara:strand:- start:575 stop:790 length:216 start_codon:yes stop_codon:yes gene_type:complete
MLKADGFDDAIMGIARRCGQPELLVYSEDKCIEILMDQGMTDEEALEYFEFNVVGSWMGEETPLFLREEDE